MKECKTVGLKVEVVKTEHELSSLVKLYSTNRPFIHHFRTEYTFRFQCNLKLLSAFFKKLLFFKLFPKNFNLYFSLPLPLPLLFPLHFPFPPPSPAKSQLFNVFEVIREFSPKSPGLQIRTNFYVWSAMRECSNL